MLCCYVLRSTTIYLQNIDNCTGIETYLRGAARREQKERKGKGKGDEGCEAVERSHISKKFQLLCIDNWRNVFYIAQLFPAVHTPLM